MTKKGKQGEYYISNKEMLNELKQYKETKIISENLGLIFLKIATRYSTKDKFCGYTYRDEMISSAIERMIMQVSQFDISRPKPNPFAYFTKVAHNQFLMILNEEKKQHSTKDRYKEYIWNEFSLQQDIEYKEDIKELII